MTPPPPEEPFYLQEIAQILGKADASMDLEEVISWLRRMQNHLNNVTKVSAAQGQTISNMQRSLGDTQDGLKATNARLSRLSERLDENVPRLDHLAAALNHLLAIVEEPETSFEKLTRKAVELWIPLRSKLEKSPSWGWMMVWLRIWRFPSH